MFLVRLQRLLQITRLHKILTNLKNLQKMSQNNKLRSVIPESQLQNMPIRQNPHGQFRDSSQKSQQMHSPPTDNHSNVFRNFGGWLASNIKTGVFVIMPILLWLMFISSGIFSQPHQVSRAVQVQSTEQNLKILQENLKNQAYKKTDKLRYYSSPRFQDQYHKIQKLKIIDFTNKASSLLKNPEYPEYLTQILMAQPYQKLPLCLITKLINTQSKQLQKQIAKSIFSQNYQNFTTIFLTDDKSLTYPQLQILQEQSSKTKQIYYLIKYPHPTYYDYRYIIHQLCPHNAFIMFVSSPLNTMALQKINNFHQLFPVYLVYSQTGDYHHVNSFAMRLFDLIGINDFGGTNQKYLRQPQQQKLLALALIELTRRFTKKLPITQLYQSQPKPTSWMTGILNSDTTVYDRQPYQHLHELSQSYRSDLQQDENKRNEQKISNKQTPNEATQLSQLHMHKAIQYQSLLFLPRQHALARRQQVDANNTYGINKRQQRPYPVIIPQMPICAVVIGNNITQTTTYQKQRYLNNIQSILNQKYTNYHIVYIDDGIQNQASQLIKQRINQHNQHKQNTTAPKLQYIKNNQPKSTVYNVMAAAYEQCGEQQLMVVIDSDFQIIGAGLFGLVNYVLHYNPNIWVLSTNYKSDQHAYGRAYRIRNQYEYREFGARVPNVKALAPLLIVQTKVVRNIPLEYLQISQGRWIKSKWYEAITHSIMQLATSAHMEYIPEISFDCSDDYYQNFIQTQLEPNEQADYIHSRPALMPLRYLNKVGQNQKIVKQALKNVDKLL